ncbi:MAG: transglutaminase domain-containing protein, partial [Synechococcaceae cyanobacterium ELA263]
VNLWQRQPPGRGDLGLPRGQNPRLEALAASWAALPAPAQRLDAARRWFRSQNFSYSTSPGSLPQRAPLDAFLFERRQGFCGHYASSFTALMRAAGVPARVVSGYRGGSWVQPIGGNGYLDLRQSDAHAWSEVWLPAEGWRQVDPSLWITSGGPGQGKARAGAMEWLQQQWWGLDIGWTRLWLGYDRQSQEALLRRLLGDRLQWLGPLVLLALGLCLTATLALLSWLQRRSPGDGPRRALEAALRQLARAGMVPEAGETLPAFAQRVERRWPQLAPELQHFVALYQQHRYAPPPRPGRAGRQLKRSRRQLSRRLQRLAP